MTRCPPCLSPLLFAVMLGAAWPAVADMPCGPMAERHGMHGHGGEAMAQHHAKLREALKLTPEQDAAWKKLLASEHPMGMDRAQAGKADDWAKLSTPERAERMLERMRSHEAAMSEHVAALKAFYATLSPEQKKIFDDAHSGPAYSGRRDRPARSTMPPAKS